MTWDWSNVFDPQYYPLYAVVFVVTFGLAALAGLMSTLR